MSWLGSLSSLSSVVFVSEPSGHDRGGGALPAGAQDGGAGHHEAVRAGGGPQHWQVSHVPPPGSAQAVTWETEG